MEEKQERTQNSEEITTEKIVKKKGMSCFLIIIIIVCIIFLLVGGCWVNRYYKTNKTGEQVVKILDAKYNRDFAVKSGRYIWATKSYQFKVYPKDEPKFVFDTFIGSMYSTGIGETYLLMRQKRETEQMVQPYLNSISKNNYFYTACNYKDNKILVNMHSKRLKLDQLLKKYPYQISVNVNASYALKITESNKDKIFKAGYNLIEFLKEKKFGRINICINLYNPEAIKGLDIKKDNEKISFHHWRDIEYRIQIKPEDIKEIKNYKNINQFLKETNFK